MRKITRNPRLIKIRDNLVFEVKRKHNLFLNEIGEIFRLRKSRISQILKGRKKNN